jgi:glycine oxidase
MAGTSDSPDVLVVGAGIIGLAVAWRARRQGMRVTVLERGLAGGGTSRVAAGMLAPVSEAEFGEGGRRALQLGLRSAQMWPGFASELEAAAGERVGFMRMGTLMVATDEDEARELERQLAFRRLLGLRARRVRASEARELEPSLAPSIRLALELADDHSVDPRATLTALCTACRGGGVELREQAPVAEVLVRGERAGGVRLHAGERLLAGALVVAAGTASGALPGLPSRAAVPVRPVKGQTLRLRDPAGPGLVRRAVRFEGGYLVPREDGRYVLGATVEERGFDEAPTAGAAYELLRDCHEVVPGVSELEVEELCVGLRPGTPDNVPVIGAGAIEGLVWATGHYRNGILLAPLTAELVCAALAGGDGEGLLEVCSPLRFASPSPRAELAEATLR